ncbi:vicilin-like seed storage protein At2g28490 [Andrographis paniculata]|uniref:vicilin-like seed storage protein At2g28490 n=1 Tax=Andrographis paniculata TaxID=175694 RepID=UPI0021E7B0FB|nr:vicilin-like seed storage protein At2g28490 [Andrographis paniculata]
MRAQRALLFAALAALLVAAAGGYGGRWNSRIEIDEEGGGEGGSQRREGTERFLLQDLKHVVKTDAGDMKVVRGFSDKIAKAPMHIGFITMEPRSLFIPQYLDSSLILFIRRGEAIVGNIHKDELVERRLKMGDIYRIAAGSAFYLVNTAEGQRLHVICSIAPTESAGWHTFQPFYIGGGAFPRSVLAGFDHTTLSTAFNVSEEELGLLLTGQDEGPIVYLSNSHPPGVWSKFLNMDRSRKLVHMKRILQMKEDDHEADGQYYQAAWSFRKILASIFGSVNERRGDRKGETGKGPDAYNLYDRKPDFKNDYGWSLALYNSDYGPLKHDDIGVYLVNLTAGSMMAPHFNPRASEFGVVLRGSGTIQIVYPNGTLAMNGKVGVGDVFWVPRYFPFCQIASRTGPFEFFGFTTSASDNKPQFLVGQGSLIHTMNGAEFAAAFGVSEERLDEMINAQKESRILPSPTVAPPDRQEESSIGIVAME